MKIINILLITLLISLGIASVSESATLNINTAKLNWSWSQGTGPLADGFIAKCGTSSGIYIRSSSYVGSSIRSAPVKDFINANGLWFCVVVAFDVVGTDTLESPPSNEVSSFFGVAPVGASGASFSAQ